MNGSAFATFRKHLNKTQEEMAQLLGSSVKAVRSYEQGWRTVPPHAERQILFLASRVRGRTKSIKPCWIVKKCPRTRRETCPAWEYQAGTMCWFICGTVCEGEPRRTWSQKMTTCRQCEVFQQSFPADMRT